ncbi:MAG TPA: ester cyclase [Pilimelia sp.]|nr:ester cyclase [Pilimelia sp.]
MATPEENIALMRSGFDALHRGDLDALAELVAEDFIANLPGLPEPLHGRETWQAGVQVMRDGFPDLQVDLEDIFGAGDKVAVRVRFRGTHTGPFQGIPPTGRSVSFSSIEIYRLAGEKIAEEWVSPDLMGLLQQISAPAHS